MLKFLYPALWISHFGMDQGWSSFNGNPRIVGDVDGDGKSDIIGFTNNGTYVSLSSGKDFGTPKLWNNAFGWSSYNLHPRFTADVNGDNKADLVGFANKYVNVSISSGSEFPWPSAWNENYKVLNGNWSSFDLYPRCLGDVNGDGKADIIGFGHDYTYISYSTGLSFSVPQNLTPEFSYNSGWKSFNYTPRLVGDVNGDEKADLIGFNETGVWVSLSFGTGFSTPTLWLGWFGNSADAGEWTSFDLFPRFVKDVNNDGKADIVGFGVAGIYIALSNGKSFDNPRLIMFHYGKLDSAGGWKSFENYPRMIGDVNGDGYNDIIGFGNEGVHVSLSMNDDNEIDYINLKAVKANSTACDAKCDRECKEYGENCLDKWKANFDCDVKNQNKQFKAGFFGAWIWILSIAVFGVLIFGYFKEKRKSTKIIYVDFNENPETPYFRA